jgi:hypothetical protein
MLRVGMDLKPCDVNSLKKSWLRERGIGRNVRNKAASLYRHGLLLAQATRLGRPCDDYETGVLRILFHGSLNFVHEANELSSSGLSEPVA